MNNDFFTTHCLAQITDRNDAHTIYICGKPVGHTDEHRDEIRGGAWTDAEHYDRGAPEDCEPEWGPPLPMDTLTAEALTKLAQSHPDYPRQIAEFNRILSEKPCAVCGDASHTGADGHRASAPGESAL